MSLVFDLTAQIESDFCPPSAVLSNFLSALCVDQNSRKPPVAINFRQSGPDQLSTIDRGGRSWFRLGRVGCWALEAEPLRDGHGAVGAIAAEPS